MAISGTKGQGWRAIPNQYRKASDILTSTLAAFLLAANFIPLCQCIPSICHALYIYRLWSR